MSEQNKTWYERLGGYDAMAAAAKRPVTSASQRFSTRLFLGALRS